MHFLHLYKKAVVLTYILFSLFLDNVYADDQINRDEIEKIIHEYIMNNPEVLIKSVEKLRLAVEQEEKGKEDYLTQNFNTFANKKNIPWQGKENATVVLVEFFDYNCGYCKKSLDAITEILNYDYDIKISFRDYPILAPTSRVAARAALASHKQKKYFLFHSNLMNFKENLSEKTIFDIAKNSNLDVKKLKKDMNDPEIIAIIENNENLAKKLGIRGTPTFLINGKLYAGALDLNRLKFLIEEALSKI